MVVDGLDDHSGLIEALQRSTDYDVLPLRGKINFWETKNLSVLKVIQVFFKSILWLDSISRPDNS
jgi:hypothetical protein